MSVPFVEKHIQQLVVSRLQEGTRRSFHLPSNPEGKIKVVSRLEKGFEGIRSFVRAQDLFQPPPAERRYYRKSLSEQRFEPIKHQRLFTRMEASKSNLKTELNEKYWLQSQRDNQKLRHKQQQLNERVMRIKSENLERNAQFWLVRVDRSKENFETAERVLNSIMRKKRIPYWDSKDLPPLSSRKPTKTNSKINRHRRKKDSIQPAQSNWLPSINRRLKQLARLLDPSSKHHIEQKLTSVQSSKQH